MKMKLLLIMILFINLLLPQIPYKEFEIVESIPLETNLDNPDIRNTPEVWLEMIKNAKTTIDIEQFYISNDKTQALEPIIQALEEQAAKGVKIRVIAEANMAKTYPETLERLTNHNIQVERINVFKESHGIQHSKYFIVDQERVFLGSQNFDWRALEHIHEIGLNIHHKEYALEMTKLFDLDWKQCQEGKLLETDKSGSKNCFTISCKDGENISFFPTASPYGNMPENFYADELAIIELIDNAKKRICIQLLSYSPSAYKKYYAKLDNAIRGASLRGVTVKLLFSDWCQKKYEMPFLKSLTILPNITVKLSTIPEYSGGYIPFGRVEHCKFMIIDDDMTWVGTSNWKKNYFTGSRNLAIVINNEKINDKLNKIFHKSWDGKYAWEIDPTKKYVPKEHGEKD